MGKKILTKLFLQWRDLVVVVDSTSSKWLDHEPLKTHNGTKITLDKKLVYPISHKRHGDSSISVVYFNFLLQVRPFPQICPGFDIVFLKLSKYDISLSASHMLNGIHSQIPTQEKFLRLKKSKLLYSKIYASCKLDIYCKQ